MGSPGGGYGPRGGMGTQGRSGVPRRGLGSPGGVGDPGGIWVRSSELGARWGGGSRIPLPPPHITGGAKRCGAELSPFGGISLWGCTHRVPPCPESIDWGQEGSWDPPPNYTPGLWGAGTPPDGCLPPPQFGRTNSDSALHTSVMNPAPQDAYLSPAQGALPPGRRENPPTLCPPTPPLGPMLPHSASPPPLVVFFLPVFWVVVPTVKVSGGRGLRGGGGGGERGGAPVGK